MAPGIGVSSLLFGGVCVGDYRYRPRHQPATRTDRMVMRPFEHWSSWLNMFLGVVLVLESTPFLAVLNIYALPGYIYGVCGGLLVIAGAQTLLGLQWPRRTISRGWAVERAGWLCSAGAWVAIAAVIYAVSPFMVFGFLVSLYMVGCSLIRWYLLSLVEVQARSDTGGQVIVK